MSIRNVVLQSAFWLPTVTIAAALAYCSGLFAKDGFVERYQTLIGAVLAVTAAIIAVIPVWRQLERVSTQANAALRETFLGRLRETRGRREEFLSPLLALQGMLSTQIIEMMEGEHNDVPAEWAFDRCQSTSAVLLVVDQQRRLWRDSQPVAAALDEIAARLHELERILDAIHRPESMDKVGEDYAISPGDWARIEADADEARKSLTAASAGFDRAVEGLSKAFDRDLGALRDRLYEVDKALMQGRI